MPEQFSHKNIHPLVWLVVGLVAVAIIAAIFLMKTDSISETIRDQELTDSTPVSLPVLEDGQPIVTTAKGRVYLEAANAAAGQAAVLAKLDTMEHNINLARLTLVYDQHKLRFERFDQQNSVLPMKLRENIEPGRIELVRGAPGDADAKDSDDGFTGNGGLFGAFIFTVLQPGSTDVRFDEQATKMFLDDGRGTEMELELQDMEFVIQ